LHHAKTPSFLIYELWDHLLDSYVVVQNDLEDRVEAMESTLISDVNDAVFRDVAELSSSLLHFRKVLMPARAVLTDLSSRKSRFISEATQPFLANMVGTVERILQDVVVAREILANSLNLYMSVVGHRTNEVMRRLTVVSVIFLPLTFLVGVYGMNFREQPELQWKYGYAAFWILTIGVATALLVLMSRKRFL
jgi:magnesium transporter